MEQGEQNKNDTLDKPHGNLIKRMKVIRLVTVVFTPLLVVGLILVFSMTLPPNNSSVTFVWEGEWIEAEWLMWGSDWLVMFMPICPFIPAVIGLVIITIGLKKWCKDICVIGLRCGLFSVCYYFVFPFVFWFMTMDLRDTIVIDHFEDSAGKEVFVLEEHVHMPLADRMNHYLGIRDERKGFFRTFKITRQIRLCEVSRLKREIEKGKQEITRDYQ